MSKAVIRVRGLSKRYGDAVAVDRVDLAVEAGEIFAFLGPNGAGKTTTVEILEGYRARSGGAVEVLGADPAHADRWWRERIGIVLQECRMQPMLTVRETVRLYAGYYRRPRRIDDTIELVGLDHKTDERAGRLSGGQQRRLDLALALIGDPELLFLDEPTTGFDPSARRQAWEVIANLRDLGKTVFLTTHYMEEAQRLADRVAIIARGRILAEGRPGELGPASERATVRFRLPGPDGHRLPETVERAARRTREGHVVVESADVVPLLNELTGWALEQGVTLEGLEVVRPSLEDVYLRLTEEAPR